MIKPSWSIALKMTPSETFTAVGQDQNQTLLLGDKKPEGKTSDTSKEKGIDKCKCLRPFVFKRYDVRIKYGKHGKLV